MSTPSADSTADALAWALGAVSVGIAMLDPDGIVTFWNDVAAELTGLDPADVVGQPFPYRTGTTDDAVEVLVDHRPFEITERPRPDGGSLVELRDTSREAGLDAARMMFLASTSHELKTPLTAISGFARWLQTQETRTEQQGEAIDAIVGAVDELQGLVEKILLSVRTESTAEDLVVERTEVIPLLTAIAAPFAVPDSAHPLSIDVDDPTLAVMCDRRAMRTAVGQLIENAIKYSPEGGPIILGATSTGDGSIEISVRDHGIGFGRGDADFLFVAFYQGDRPVKGGVGLGLSIVRRLTEAQGGSVGATGQPGVGATFTMTLPAA